MKILLCEPNKLARETEIDGSLESMQETVGGIITAIYPYDEPVAVVANDEGLLLGLPLNRKIDENTILAGTFFVCGLSEDDFASLDDELMKKFKKKLLYPDMFVRVNEKIMAIPFMP